MRLIPTASTVSAAAANVTHKVLYGRLADLRPMPHSLIDEGPRRSVHHYHRPTGQPTAGTPVLLVPPLAAPALCFDLRRGCSMIEHLVGTGRPTYLVDYGEISFADRHLGLEHWIDEVIPTAIRTVDAHSGGQPVHLVGWCLGGIMALLTAADNQALPIRSITTVAAPFDVTAVPFVAPLRPLVNATGGQLVSPLYRLLGGAPAPVVRAAYQLSALDKYLSKPLVVAMNLADADFLAQIEAVDNFTANMLAYPGRTFGQLYHRLFRANDLAFGYLDLGGRRIELARLDQPVLIIGGEGDTLAPVGAVRHLAELLPAAASVRFETAPGGHLGVLTGRAARGTTWRIIDEHLAAHDPSPA